MENEPIKRRYPKFSVRGDFIGYVIVALLWDYFHPENHFMVAFGTLLGVVATEAGLGLAKSHYPGSAAAKVLIVAASWVPAAGAWYLVASHFFKRW